MFRLAWRYSCPINEISSAFSKLQVRTKQLHRTPVTDTTPYIEKLEPSQLNTAVFVRRHEVPLLKKYQTQKKLRKRHYIYDKINLPPQPLQEVEVILVKSVPGIGAPGAKIKVRGDKAYRDFLLPGLAIYGNPQNEKKYASILEEAKKDVKQFSSISVERTISVLSKMMLSVSMNMDNPWTVEKWHIRVSFRKTGIVVPEECIELPSKPICGPNLELNGKHFLVTITINNTEKVRVRCRLFHFTPNTDRRLPFEPYYWLYPIDPIFEEEAELFKSFPPVRGPYPSEEEKLSLGLPLS